MAYTLGEVQTLPASPKYTHIVWQLGIFRFSYYHLGKKYTLRLELSSGWE